MNFEGEFYFSQNRVLNMSNVFLIIENNSPVSKQVQLELFKDRYFEKEGYFTNSIIIELKSGSNRFRMSEIFNENVIYNDLNSMNSICMQLVDIQTLVSLLNSCEYVKSDVLGNKEAKSKRFVNFNSNLIYEVDYNNGNSPLLDEVNPIQSLSYSGDLSLKNIPFTYSGYNTNFNDPHFNYDLSQFTFYFDVQKWNSKIRGKTQSYFDREKSKILSEFPLFDKISERSDYIDQIKNSSNYEKDIRSLGDLCNVIDLSEDQSKKNLEDIIIAKQYTLDSMKSSRELLLLKYKNDYTDKEELNLKISEADSLISLDSINLVYLKIYDHKTKAYEKMEKIKVESNNYLNKANQALIKYEEQKNMILSNPRSLNNILKKSGNFSDLEHFVNYIDEFRIGNVNPNYSSLVFNNSKQTGVSGGVKIGKYKFSSFISKSKLLNSGPDLQLRDTLVSELHGMRLSFKPNDRLETSAFIINNFSAFNQKISLPERIVGYNVSYIISDDFDIDYELAWSHKGEVFNEADQSNTLVRSMAMKSKFKGKVFKGKLKLESELDYYGSNFQDFSQFSFRRNTINLKSLMSIRVNSQISGGFNYLLTKYNILEMSSSIDRLQSLGFNFNYLPTNKPSLQYFSQFSSSVGDSLSFKSTSHNISSFSAFNLFNVEQKISINTSFSTIVSDLDTLNSDYIGLNIDYTAEISTVVFLRSRFDYFVSNDSSNNKNKNLTLSFSAPINFEKISCEFGIRSMSTNVNQQYGYNIRCNLKLCTNLSVILSVDSLRQDAIFDENGKISYTFQSHYIAKLNYIF